MAEGHAQRIAGAQRAFDAVTQLQGMFPIPTPDPTNPNTLRAKYALAVLRIESAWSHEQEVGNMPNLTCYQKGQVEYAAGEVSYARSQLQYQDTEFETFDRSATSDLAVAHSSMNLMQQIYPVLRARHRESRQLVSSTPEAQLTQGSIDKIKRALLPMLDQFSSRLSAVRGIARDADRSGDTLDAKAKDFPNSLTCSG